MVAIENPIRPARRRNGGAGVACVLRVCSDAANAAWVSAGHDGGVGLKQCAAVCRGKTPRQAIRRAFTGAMSLLALPQQLRIVMDLEPRMTPTPVVRQARWAGQGFNQVLN